MVRDGLELGKVLSLGQEQLDTVQRLQEEVPVLLLLALQDRDEQLITLL